MSRVIDPDSDDFIAQFDRAFGPPNVELGRVEPPALEPAAPAPAEFDGDSFAPDDENDADATPISIPTAATQQSVLARAGKRLVRRPYTWATRPWSSERIVQVATATACLVVTTVIMMHIVHWDPLRNGPDLIRDNTTPTGGDMGSHVWGPAYLRDHLLPNWQFSGWSMDWYGGFPIYRFYMVIPALAIVALDTFLPYGVAFKYVVIAGVVTFPFCCWAFGRLARFRYPLPEMFTLGALCFLLNESHGYHLQGGNVLSTFAGEFSFSIALSLMVLGWGLLARGLDEGKYRSWAAIILALACLCHGIVLIYTIVGAVAIVGCRLAADAWRRRSGDSVARNILAKRTIYAVTVGGLTLLLAAFWVGPFVFNHDYMTDMKYTAQPSGSSYNSFWAMFFDQRLAFDVIINALAVVGLVGCIVRRHVYGIALGVTGLVAVALVYLSRDSLPLIGLLWNPRVLPLVYFVRYLLMMVGAVELGGAVVNFLRDRPGREVPSAGSNAVVLGSTAVVVLAIFGWTFQVLPFDSYTKVGSEWNYSWGPFRAPDPERDGWTRSDSWPVYNFKGYEGRGGNYNEYYDVVQTMDQIGADRGCGRALWENNKANKPYGTTMALMLLPFWTDSCIGSMEGLFFEASGTTPYHFLTGAAMSDASSNPVRQLRYINNDASVGVEYLQTLGVRYVMVRTADAVAEAEEQPELTRIAESGPWRIYEVADTGIVVPLATQPVVVNARGGDQRERFLELGTSWFQNQDEWPVMPADDGPDTWQRIDVVVDQSQEKERTVSVVEPVQDIAVVPLPAVTVSGVDINQQDLSFDVSEIGVPVLVRVSYFPNWSVEGADGPYRIGPNQMVVIPTSTHVRLQYDRSNSDLFFYALTLVGIAFAIVLRVRGDAAIPTATVSTVDSGQIWSESAVENSEVLDDDRGGRRPKQP